MFVIRSMSTTDARPGQQVTPYHIYLLPVSQRAGAWWGSLARAMSFATKAEAEQHIDDMGGRLKDAEIVPHDADQRGMPTYWDNQRARFIQSAREAGCTAAQQGRPRDTFHPYTGDASRAWYASYDNAVGFARESGRSEPLLDRG